MKKFIKSNILYKYLCLFDESLKLKEYPSMDATEDSIIKSSKGYTIEKNGHCIHIKIKK